MYFIAFFNHFWCLLINFTLHCRRRVCKQTSCINFEGLTLWIQILHVASLFFSTWCRKRLLKSLVFSLLDNAPNHHLVGCAILKRIFRKSLYFKCTCRSLWSCISVFLEFKWYCLFATYLELQMDFKMFFFCQKHYGYRIMCCKWLKWIVKSR